MEAKRPLIGILVSGISDSFTLRICRGAFRAAKYSDIDVVVLPGKYLDRDLTEDYQFCYEYQYNVLFQLAMEHGVDGVIITSGSIGCYATAEKLQEFMEHFADIPCVIMGDKAKEIISVNYDNREGIRQGMKYLIEQLHCKHLVFMEGPMDNIDSRERKHTFLSVLREYHLETDEKRCIRFDINRKPKELFADYLKEHTKVDGVICVNDETALSVYEELKAQGIIPGKEIYVMGYDNTILGAKAKPALSSVMADPAGLGERAIELVLQQLRGEKVESIILPTEFVKRESFGNEELESIGSPMGQLEYAQIDNYYKKIFYRYIDEENDIRFHKMFREIMERLIYLYQHGIENISSNGDILKLIRTFLRMGTIKYADTNKLLEHIEEIHRLFYEKYENTEYARMVFKVFSQVYREIIIVEEHLQGDMIEVSEKRNFSITTFASESMQFEQGSDQSYQVLFKNLDWLGIQNADLYLYETPQTNLVGEKYVSPNHIYQKAMLREGRVKKVHIGKRRKRWKELLRNIPYEKGNHVKIVFPVFANESLYGVFACDMTDMIFEYGDFLAGQIGNAAKMIHLLKQNKHIQEEYEKSLTRLRENNIVLDNLAKSDGLTGTLNRRGFMEAAQVRLQENREKRIDTMVAYIDMNNLKIVNDRYGHDEGDFSIRHISDMLNTLFPLGIVGRIGGDEFALICDYEGDTNGDEIVQEIYAAFQKFNEGSDKAYNVTVSAGICIVREEWTLLDALGVADEKLYVEKQQRSKNVAK